MGRLIDLTGKKFTRLTVIKRKEMGKYINGEAFWECVCDCHDKTIIFATGRQLRRGDKTSCGCLYTQEKRDYLYHLKYELETYSKLNGQCMEYVVLRDKKRRGKINFLQHGIEKSILSHKASWLVHVGDVPRDMVVLQKCNNPSCHRIEHLYLARHQDIVGKDRNVFIGQQSVLSKITEVQAREILALKGGHTSSHVLAKIYGISASTIRCIWQRRTWKHLENDDLE